MNFQDKLYFCNNCKKIVPSAGELLFIEDGSQRGFCSEKCIETFFAPIVLHYEQIENCLRKEINIQEEDIRGQIDGPEYMESLLCQPQEIWRLENELHEEVYAFHKEFNDKHNGRFYLVTLCFVFNSAPSFIILSTASRHREFINRLKIGSKLDDISAFLEKGAKNSNNYLQLTPQDIELLEKKKSNFLAEILSLQNQQERQDDIPFEDYHKYETCYKTTLEVPDELFGNKDNDGDYIYTYIKAFQINDKSFFYYVICLEHREKNYQGQNLLIPIISFPSLNGNIYRRFCKGDKLIGNIKN